MLYCPFCNASNRDGSYFCNSCGQNLSASISCPGCRALNSAHARFCSHCGAPLPATVPERQPAGADWMAPAAVSGLGRAVEDAARFVDERELPSLEADVDSAALLTPGGSPNGSARLTAEDLSIIEWYEAIRVADAPPAPPLSARFVPSPPVPAPALAPPAAPGVEASAGTPWTHAADVTSRDEGILAVTISAPAAPALSPPRLLPGWLDEIEPIGSSITSLVLPGWLSLPDPAPAVPVPPVLPDWLSLTEVAVPAPPPTLLPAWLFLSEPPSGEAPPRSLPDWILLSELLPVTPAPAPPIPPSLPPVELPAWLELQEPEIVVPAATFAEVLPSPAPAPLPPVPAPERLPQLEPVLAAAGAPAGGAIAAAKPPPVPEEPPAYDYGGGWTLVRRLRQQVEEAERLAAQQALAEQEETTPADEWSSPKDAAADHPQRPGWFQRLFVRRSPSERPERKSRFAWRSKRPHESPVKPEAEFRPPRRGLLSRFFVRRK